MNLFTDGPRNSQHARLQAALSDHVKIGPVTGIEELIYAGTFVIEVEVPSQQLGHSKSEFECHEEFFKTQVELIPTEIDHRTGSMCKNRGK